MIRDADGNVIFEANLDEDKAQRGRLAYKWNGKIMSCLTYALKFGEITREILVQILKEFDTRNVLPRANDKISVIVIDGH